MAAGRHRGLLKREHEVTEAFIGAENRVLKEQGDVLDKAYVRSQREVYELREMLRKQKKLLDRIPKEMLEAVQMKGHVTRTTR